MSKSQDDNSKNDLLKFGDTDVFPIDDMAGIHSTSDSTSHIRRSQREQVEAIEGKKKGFWQTKEKVEG